MRSECKWVWLKDLQEGSGYKADKPRLWLLVR
jgi:hypothetical protein